MPLADVDEIEDDASEFNTLILTADHYSRTYIHSCNHVKKFHAV
jgi:hypothetical protein